MADRVVHVSLHSRNLRIFNDIHIYIRVYVMRYIFFSYRTTSESLRSKLINLKPLLLILVSLLHNYFTYPVIFRYFMQICNISKIYIFIICTRHNSQVHSQIKESKYCVFFVTGGHVCLKTIVLFTSGKLKEFRCYCGIICAQIYANV